MTSVRTTKREPRRASGAEELARVKLWRLATMRAVMSLNGTVAGKAPKLELGVTRVKAGWGRLYRGPEGEDASMRN